MERTPYFLLRPLPAALEPLATLALNLRWTWSHAGDAMWRRVNPDVWDRTQNLWVTLQESSQLCLDQVAQDPAVQGERLARQLGQRGTAPEIVAQAAQVLDPNVLTLGFARRFAAYK